MIPAWFDTREKDLARTPFYDLEFYLYRLRTRQYFARPYWGDAEVRMGILKEDFLINSQTESGAVECERVLKKGAKYIRDGISNFFISVMDKDKCFGLYDCSRFTNRVPNVDGLGFFNFLEAEGLKDYRWHNGLMFQFMTQTGGLWPLLKQYNLMKVCVIAPKQCKTILDKGFKCDHWIECVQDKSHGIDQAPAIMDEILKYNKDNTVYLFCVGEGSTILITDLFECIPNNWFIDMGVCFDELSGYKYAGHDIPNERDPVLFQQKRKQFYDTINSNLILAYGG